MAHPRFRKARNFKTKRYTAGDLSLTTSAVWAVVDSSLDVVLAAAAGDVLRAELSLYCASAAGHLYFDAHTLVSSTLTHQFATGNASSTVDDGVPAWLCTASTQSNPAGSVYYELVSGDISSGFVTVRLAYHASATRGITSNSGRPLLFTVENLGPADPH